MKFAAYTNDSIWAVGATADEAGGTEVMFDLVNGTLVVDHDEDGQQVA
jgi:hypothetical protein